MEALGTELTAEGLEAGVLAAVGDEVGALAEGFATYLAFVGLLSCRAKKMVRKISKEKKICLPMSVLSFRSRGGLKPEAALPPILVPDPVCIQGWG